MNERWIEFDPASDEKQEAWLDNWSDTADITFDSPEAEEKYKERCEITRNAIQMKKSPKRIPIHPAAGYFPIQYAGITYREALYDFDKVRMANERYMKDFDPDGGCGTVPSPGKVFDILDYRSYLWAGHGLKDDEEIQYVEREYMRADEYQDLIDDPTGWFLESYLPRIAGNLEGLSLFPLVAEANEIVGIPGITAPFGLLPLREACNALTRAGEQAIDWFQKQRAMTGSMQAKGYPQMFGGGSKAPLDLLGDTLRGTKEFMMDLFRRPDEVLEACDKLTPLMIKAGIRACQKSGRPFCYMALHKGADGFMSQDQFDVFYWPTLRKVIVGLVNQGIIPMLFAEGSYNTRLKSMADLPKGKVIWFFDRTDMKLAKNTVGKNNCIKGNFPIDLLYAGSVQEVETYCHELINNAGEGGGFIFSTGASMQNAKVENVRAMFQTAKKY